MNNLQVYEKTKAVGRIWIPKPGKQGNRPPGIPTIRERARQALMKLALEPEREARFEGNSYGFRSGRSVHDAIKAIFLVLEECQNIPSMLILKHVLIRLTSMLCLTGLELIAESNERLRDG